MVRVGKRGVNGLTTAYVDLGPDGRAVTDPNITTTVRAENLTYKAALEAALRHASVPLTYTIGSGEGVVIRATAPIPPPPFLQGNAKGTGLPKTPVTLEANDMPLRVALEQVFDQAKQSYSVDNRVVGTVTGTYKAVPLNELLPRLLALSATPLEYIVQNGAVYVRSTAAAPTAPAGAPQPPAPAPASPQPAAPPPAASPAPATPAPQSQRSPALDDLVSADFRALHIEEAFRQALAGSGLTLGWDQGVNPAAYKETIVTLKATSVDRESLLNLICRSQGMKAPPDRIASPLSLPSRLFWRLDGNTVRLITERPSAGIGYSQRGADALPEGRVTLHFPEPTPLTTVLKELFRGTGIGIQIAVEGAPAITTSVTAENATFEEALSAILRNASRRLVYRLPSQGLIQFQDAPSTRPPVAVSYAPKPDPIPGDAQGTGLPKTRVTLIAENMSLRDALFKVFAAVRQDFTVDNAVTGTVTGEFKDVPLNELVPRLLAQAALPTEYYVAGNNVVIIRPARQR